MLGIPILILKTAVGKIDQLEKQTIQSFRRTACQGHQSILAS